MLNHGEENGKVVSKAAWRLARDARDAKRKRNMKKQMMDIHKREQRYRNLGDLLAMVIDLRLAVCVLKARSVRVMDSDGDGEGYVGRHGYGEETSSLQIHIEALELYVFDMDGWLFRFKRSECKNH